MQFLVLLNILNIMQFLVLLNSVALQKHLDDLKRYFVNLFTITFLLFIYSNAFRDIYGECLPGGSKAQSILT